MAAKPLTSKEEKEGRVERIAPGNLRALREIDDNPNVAIARLLEENKQLNDRIASSSVSKAGSSCQPIDYERIGNVLDERLKIPVDILMKKSLTAEEVGNIMQARLNTILSPFMEH